MGRLSLSAALAWSDRVAAIFDGSVRPQGIDLNVVTGNLGEIFWRRIHNKEFAVSEMSLASYAIQHSRGNRDFWAIPIFPSRMFRHSAIYIRADAGIREPRDLSGKRIGVPEYQMTAAIWVRTMLMQEYDFDPKSVQWSTGGVDNPGRQERIPLEVPEGFSIRPIQPGQTLSALLLDDEIDALITPLVPKPFLECNPKVARLFPDVKRAEMDYFEPTQTFPIMHTVVIQRSICEQHPWVPTELAKMFTEGKRLAMQRMHDTDFNVYALAWLPGIIAEHHADFDDVVARAGWLEATVVLPVRRNPPEGEGNGPSHREIWIKDPDALDVTATDCEYAHTGGSWPSPDRSQRSAP